MNDINASHPEIPVGGYCYKIAPAQGARDSNSGFMIKTVLCQHFTHREVNGVWLPYCSLLNRGSVPAEEGALTGDDKKRLIAAWGEDEKTDWQGLEWVKMGAYESLEAYYADEKWFKVPEEFDLFLLWDQVKECGINMDDPEEDTVQHE